MRLCRAARARAAAELGVPEESISLADSVVAGAAAAVSATGGPFIGVRSGRYEVCSAHSSALHAVLLVL